MSQIVDIDLKTIVLTLRLDYLKNPHIFHIYLKHPLSPDDKCLLIGGLMPDGKTPFVDIQCGELVGGLMIERYSTVFPMALKMAQDEIEKLKKSEME